MNINKSPKRHPGSPRGVASLRRSNTDPVPEDFRRDISLYQRKPNARSANPPIRSAALDDDEDFRRDTGVSTNGVGTNAGTATGTGTSGTRRLFNPLRDDPIAFKETTGIVLGPALTNQVAKPAASPRRPPARRGSLVEPFYQPVPLTPAQKPAPFSGEHTLAAKALREVTGGSGGGGGKSIGRKKEQNFLESVVGNGTEVPLVEEPVEISRSYVPLAPPAPIQDGHSRESASSSHSRRTQGKSRDGGGGRRSRKTKPEYNTGEYQDNMSDSQSDRNNISSPTIRPSRPPNIQNEQQQPRILKKLYYPNISGGAGGYREIRAPPKTTTRSSGEYERDSTNGRGRLNLSPTLRPLRSPSHGPPPHRRDRLGSQPQEPKDEHTRIRDLYREITGIEKTISTEADQRSKMKDRDWGEEDSRRSLPTPAAEREQEEQHYDPAAMEVKIQRHIQLANLHAQVSSLDPEYVKWDDHDARCWKWAIYTLVEEFREAMRNIGTHDPVIFRAVRHQFEDFLSRAEKFYREWMEELRAASASSSVSSSISSLPPLSLPPLSSSNHSLSAPTSSASVSVENWVGCINYLGDLSRYRYSYLTSNLVDKQHALTYYLDAIHHSPGQGKFYFRVAMLATTEFERLYWWTRSLVVGREDGVFYNAREQMGIMFENNRKAVGELPSAAKNNNNRISNGGAREAGVMTMCSDPEALFIRLHGMLFTKIGLDRLEDWIGKCLDAIFDPARRALYQEGFWLKAGLINLAAVYSYDYSASAIRRVGELRSQNAETDFGNFSDEQDLDINTKYNEGLAPLRKVVEKKDMDMMKRLENSIGDIGIYDIEQEAPLIEQISMDPVILGGLRWMAAMLIGVVNAYVERDPAGDDLPPEPAEEDDGAEHNEDVESDIVVLDFTTMTSAESVKAPLKTTRNDPEGWLMYIEVIVTWMACSGLFIARELADGTKATAWQKIIGASVTFPNGDFWSALTQSLTTCFQELSEFMKNELILTVLGSTDDEEVCLQKPFWRGSALLEEWEVRGVGWFIEGGLFNARGDGDSMSGSGCIGEEDSPVGIKERRRARIAEAGLWLTRQMGALFEFDPVKHLFTFSPILLDSTLTADINTAISTHIGDYDTHEVAKLRRERSDTAEEGDFEDSPEEEYEEEEDDLGEEMDEAIRELKLKRRRLQSLLAASREQQRMERNRGRKQKQNYNAKSKHSLPNNSSPPPVEIRIAPGRTTLVIDTNCFIGDREAVQIMIESGKFTVVIPLVVVTELDGLKVNPPPLGTAAAKALEFLESSLSPTRRLRHLKIQTSHNNFLHDISIRSEQFGFGEDDRNLDDLILGACIWWNEKDTSHKDIQDSVEKVCLVTGDRNLRVKARARGVEVVDMQTVRKLI